LLFGFEDEWDFEEKMTEILGRNLKIIEKLFLNKMGNRLLREALEAVEAIEVCLGLKRYDLD
jgi:hypothetical protein